MDEIVILFGGLVGFLKVQQEFEMYYMISIWIGHSHIMNEYIVLKPFKLINY